MSPPTVRLESDRSARRWRCRATRLSSAHGCAAQSRIGARLRLHPLRRHLGPAGQARPPPTARRRTRSAASVALSGDTAVVGATGSDVGVVQRQGVGLRLSAAAAPPGFRTGQDGRRRRRGATTPSASRSRSRATQLSSALSYGDVDANPDQGSAYVFTPFAPYATMQRRRALNRQRPACSGTTPTSRATTSRRTSSLNRHTARSILDPNGSFVFTPEAGFTGTPRSSTGPTTAPTTRTPSRQPSRCPGGANRRARHRGDARVRATLATSCWGRPRSARSLISNTGDAPLTIGELALDSGGGTHRRRRRRLPCEVAPGRLGGL